LLTLRAEHHAVDHEGGFIAEELRDANGSVGTFEEIVFGNFTPGGQSAAECSDVLDAPAELDFLTPKCVASPAIFGALVGKVRFVFGGEIRCRNEDGIV